MGRTIEIAKAGGAVVGLLTATLTLASWINQGYVDYLERHFATKEDMARMESKLDSLKEDLHGFSQDQLQAQRHAAAPAKQKRFRP